jgi:hypothetical protein
MPEMPYPAPGTRQSGHASAINQQSLVAFQDAARRVNPPPQAMLVSESVYLRVRIRRVRKVERWCVCDW